MCFIFHSAAIITAGSGWGWWVGVHWFRNPPPPLHFSFSGGGYSCRLSLPLLNNRIFFFLFVFLYVKHACMYNSILNKKQDEKCIRGQRRPQIYLTKCENSAASGGLRRSPLSTTPAPPPPIISSGVTSAPNQGLTRPLKPAGSGTPLFPSPRSGPQYALSMCFSYHPSLGISSSKIADMRSVTCTTYNFSSRG